MAEASAMEERCWQCADCPAEVASRHTATREGKAENERGRRQGADVDGRDGQCAEEKVARGDGRVQVVDGEGNAPATRQGETTDWTDEDERAARAGERLINLKRRSGCVARPPASHLHLQRTTAQLHLYYGLPRRIVRSER